MTGRFYVKMNNHQDVSHGSRIDGFLTKIRLYTADEVTIIIFSNRQTTNVLQLADQVGRPVRAIK